MLRPNFRQNPVNQSIHALASCLQSLSSAHNAHPESSHFKLSRTFANPPSWEHETTDRMRNSSKLSHLRSWTNWDVLWNQCWMYPPGQLDWWLGLARCGCFNFKVWGRVPSYKLCQSFIHVLLRSCAVVQLSLKIMHISCANLCLSELRKANYLNLVKMSA